MDEAFVENAENDVDHKDRGKDQERLAGQRVAERLRGALETRGHARRKVRLALDALDRGNRFGKRYARREVERDRNRRLLLLM